MRLLIDMDGVIADFQKTAWDRFEEDYPLIYEDYPRQDSSMEFYVENTYDNLRFKNIIREIQSQPGFFKDFEPIEGAVEALHDLEKDFQVFICTAPLLENPTCTNDKLWWIDKHLGGDWIRRTIITKDKTVVDGDILIDDKPIITGISEEPIWQRVLYDQPYNKNVVGRRLNWQIDYRKILNSVW